MNFKNVKLVTSSENKLKEFEEIVNGKIIVEKGQDLKEVHGNMDEVIIYKSLAAGAGLVVEDTILKIDGVEVVDIKWNKQYELQNAKKCCFIVSIGYNNGTHIEIFRDMVNGILVSPDPEGGFAFDPYFLPDGAEETLSQLKRKGLKNKYSARAGALLKFLNGGKSEYKIAISDIEPWKGEYQNQ